MLKYCFLSLMLTCFIHTISSQRIGNDTLLSGYVDFPFPNTLFSKEKHFKRPINGYLKPEKIIWPVTGSIPGNSMFSADEAWSFWVHDYVTDSTKNLYEDEELKNLITGTDRINIFSSQDTVSPYGGNWDYPYYKIVLNEIIVKDIKGVRVKQTCIWNNQSSELEIDFSAYAPLVYNYDDNGNFKNVYPLAWAPIEYSEKSRSHLMEVPTVPFVFSTQHNVFHTQEAGSQLEATIWKPIIENTLENSPDNFILGSDDKSPLFENERQSLIYSLNNSLPRNSIEIEHEEKYSRREESIDWKYLVDIRVFVRWHWDNINHSFNCQLLGWAPIKAVHDESNNYLYHWPLFYRLNDIR